MLRLDGKVALVTGIGAPENEISNGKAIATVLARQGAIIEGIDREKTFGEATVNSIESEGGKAHLTVGDVTSQEDVDAWVEACIKKHGKIDILVNNVGQSQPGGPNTMNYAEWRNQLCLNLDSVYLATHAVLPHMTKAQTGSIVNISSIAGMRYIGKPQIAYSTAKAGIIQFTKASAIIHAKDNIRMNCVVPGLMHTPMLKRMAEKYANGDLNGFIAQRNEQIPMGKMGNAWDVANAALFLASDEACYVTATEIVVDGGITAATQAMTSIGHSQ